MVAIRKEDPPSLLTRCSARDFRGSAGAHQFPDVQLLAVSPQPFQIVVGPGLLGKNVDNQVEVIHQHPLGVPVSLDMVWDDAAFFQPGFDFVGDRLDLPRRIPRAEQEVSRERSDPRNVECDDVDGLLVVHGLKGDPQRIRHDAP